jgi:hypothetical protein
MAGKAKKETDKPKWAFVPKSEMTDREKGIWFQGMNFKEKTVKEKLGLFVPKKQK